MQLHNHLFKPISTPPPSAPPSPPPCEQEQALAEAQFALGSGERSFRMFISGEAKEMPKASHIIGAGERSFRYYLADVSTQ